MPAVRVVQPGDAVHAPVTTFGVQFHEYYQPGTFRAFLDGQEITSSFAPAGVPSGTASAGWSQSYTGGEMSTSAGYVGAPQAAYQSLATMPSGTYTHKLRVTGSCKAGTVCADSDEQAFNPVAYVASPAPLIVPVGATVILQLRADRSLSGPLTMTVAPRLLSPPTQAANHVQVSGAGPGAPATVTLPAGTAAVPVSVSGLSPGGFYLLLSAPGTQQSSVVGTVK
jgi:hypothetical protein